MAPLGRLWRAVTPSYWRRKRVRRLAAHADAARDAGDHLSAADLYEQALRFAPEHAGIRVQAGHMRKEARQFDLAERHYLRAAVARPGDADLALQLGHFYKVCGRFEEAVGWYGRAVKRAPDWIEAGVELALARRLHGPVPPAGMSRAVLARLVPQLDPAYSAPPAEPRERIEVRRLGRLEEGLWGFQPTLSGIEAIRGYCISASPIVAMDIFLDGNAIHREPVEAHPLASAAGSTALGKYVFNAWLDFSGYARRLHMLELRLHDAAGATRSAHSYVVIGDPVAEDDYPASDALVEPRPGDDRTIEEQIRSRPSMIRPARRALLPAAPGKVLVLRTDQLGDMVASVPALERLRALLPAAHIVGLVTGANVGLARTLPYFDELIEIDFPDDPVERRRIMPVAEQDALRRRLASHAFDIALDLAPSDVSRDLLRLSGAKFTYGFAGGDRPWLSGSFALATPDRWGRMETAPHSARTLALVEALGALLPHDPVILRRPDLTRSRLRPYGIGDEERFIVLHTGARIAFSRWPHYAALAERLIAQTDCKIVLIAGEDEPPLSPPLAASDRMIRLGTDLPFDDFDALLSFAEIMIGNDSGPKHLAALRGTKTVTLFSARIGWSEWGQDQTGTIISRRVPCAGCALFHDPEECGKGFACIRDIGVEEVFDAVAQYL